MEKITVKDDGLVVDGEIIDRAEINRIARMNCKGLLYLMNIMDDDTGRCYMWFKDDDKGVNYLLEF